MTFVNEVPAAIGAGVQTRVSVLKVSLVSGTGAVAPVWLAGTSSAFSATDSNVRVTGAPVRFRRRAMICSPVRPNESPPTELRLISSGA